jgi:hypothetical protein
VTWRDKKGRLGECRKPAEKEFRPPADQVSEFTTMGTVGRVQFAIILSSAVEKKQFGQHKSECAFVTSLFSPIF